MLVASVAGYLLLTVGEPGVIVVAALLAGGLDWAWPSALTWPWFSAARTRPPGRWGS